MGGHYGEKIYDDHDSFHGYSTYFPRHDSNCKPDNYITRAEAVTMFNRMLKRYADHNFIDINKALIADYTDDDGHWAYYDIHEASNDHVYRRIENSNEKWYRIIEN